MRCSPKGRDAPVPCPQDGADGEHREISTAWSGLLPYRLAGPDRASPGTSSEIAPISSGRMVSEDE